MACGFDGTDGGRRGRLEEDKWDTCHHPDICANLQQTICLLWHTQSQGMESRTVFPHHSCHLRGRHTDLFITWRLMLYPNLDRSLTLKLNQIFSLHDLAFCSQTEGSPLRLRSNICCHSGKVWFKEILAYYRKTPKSARIATTWLHRRSKCWTDVAAELTCDLLETAAPSPSHHAWSVLLPWAFTESPYLCCLFFKLNKCFKSFTINPFCKWLT